MSTNHTYAQSGEDIILDFILNTIKIDTRAYLDIGAHHATYLSNTYYFYEKGFSGVCVEPDPVLCAEIKKTRPKDVCLQVGISDGVAKKTPFYIMDPPTLNTFSKKEADLYQKFYPWTSIVKETHIDLVDVNAIIHKNFKKSLDILSVDTEGMDLQIIKGIDLLACRPKVICVETAIYSENNTLKKNAELIQYLLSNDYFVYADTFVNTLFVDVECWKKNGGPRLENFNAYN